MVRVDRDPPAGKKLVRGERTDDPVDMYLRDPSVLWLLKAQKIGDRTKAGMARARAAGKRIGRPGVTHRVQEKIAQHVAEGLSAYRISKALRLDYKTVRKYADAGPCTEGATTVATTSRRRPQAP